jgi:hypothetical protein
VEEVGGMKRGSVSWYFREPVTRLNFCSLRDSDFLVVFDVSQRSAVGGMTNFSDSLGSLALVFPMRSVQKSLTRVTVEEGRVLVAIVPLIAIAERDCPSQRTRAHKTSFKECCMMVKWGWMGMWRRVGGGEQFGKDEVVGGVFEVRGDVDRWC